MIRLSRHARNNIRLYKIELQEIVLTINSPEQKVHEGNRVVALRAHPNNSQVIPLRLFTRG